MKPIVALILALASLCVSAQPAIINGQHVTTGTTSLYSGAGTGSALAPGCAPLPKNVTKATAYTCKTPLTVAPLAVQPKDKTDTAPCGSGYTGTYPRAMTSTYDLATNTWPFTNVWTPAEPPKTAPCVAIPPVVVPPPAAAWTKVADENGAFTVAASSTVRYGVDTRWVQKVISGASACTTAVFGSDPAQGTFKRCEVSGAVVVPPVTPPVTPPVVTPPSTTTVSSWSSIARDVDPFKPFTANGLVRYGHPAYPNGWITKTISGASQCVGSNFLGPDPAPGLYKECQVLQTAPAVVQTGGAPVVNVGLIPPPQRGWSTANVTSGGGFDAGPFDIGAFRTNCAVSHFLFDDPIVFPGQPGKSHLHMFFGNTGTSASTTATSLATTGDSTCNGGTANRTGYWIAAMIDLKTGAPVVPDGSSWYYKSAYYGVAAESVKPFPVGLRMIAGSAANTSQAGASPYVRMHCGSGAVLTSEIPNCAVGDTVAIGIQFPQCWDGKNLDSPDHKGHMAYASEANNPKGCPSTHPVPLPEVALNMSYMVLEPRPDLNWKLSSDNYVGVGGYSMHADWFNGWDADIQKTWITNCINKKASSSNALCDGRYLN